MRRSSHIRGPQMSYYQDCNWPRASAFVLWNPGPHFLGLLLWSTGTARLLRQARLWETKDSSHGKLCETFLRIALQSLLYSNLIFSFPRVRLASWSDGFLSLSGFLPHLLSQTFSVKISFTLMEQIASQRRREEEHDIDLKTKVTSWVVGSNLRPWQGFTLLIVMAL